MRKSEREPNQAHSINAILGGPSYQLLTDARHTGSMVGLAAALIGSRQLTGIAVNYMSACPVEMARNELFKSALVATEATHLFWADSDVYWDASHELVWGANWLTAEPSHPMMVVPVEQRNGDSNIMRDDFKRLRGSFVLGRTPLKCMGAGLGLAIFNLQWYRRHWPESPWFRTEWHELGFDRQAAPLSRFISEDIWHTMRLRQLGDSCYWAPLCQTWHATRGEVTRGTGAEDTQA